jgi:C4-dicarboxylate transporter DctM subunit
VSNVQFAIAILTGMLLLIAVRVPIGAAMFAAGAIGYWYKVGDTALLNYLKGLAWGRFSTYDLSVIPLFLLMGQFATSAGLSRKLFQAATTLIGHKKGGVAQAAIVACAAFGSICGSSVATAATMSQVALPEMKRLKYSNRLSTGTLAVGGTLGILIPPSVILIIYAVLAEQNIVKLFAAALIPGLIAAIGYIVVIAVYVRVVPGHATEHAKASRQERMRAIVDALPIALIFLLLFVGIYGGFFTATQGAAVATAATLLLAFLLKFLSVRFKNPEIGGMDLADAVRCCLPAAKATAMIFMVLLGAAMMNTALAVTQVPNALAVWVEGSGIPPLVIVAGFLVVFIILAAVLDEIALMLLLLPILLPSILALDLFGLTNEYKAIWFGVLMLMVIEIGLIAPPIGLNVYVVANIARTVPIGEIYRGIMPFLISDFLRVVLLLLVPQITLAGVWMFEWVDALQRAAR